jgi:hypothetical protein
LGDDLNGLLERAADHIGDLGGSLLLNVPRHYYIIEEIKKDD